MNAKNGRNAMSASKTLSRRAARLLCGVLLTAGVIPAAHAAPALQDVQEVVVQYPRITGGTAADMCGLSRADLTSSLVTTLQGLGVPAVSVLDAKPLMIGAARIELTPETATLNNQGIECTSWVELRAQTKNTLHIPPVELRREVTVVYWRAGQLANSGETQHANLVKELLLKQGRQFGEQYKADQPSAIPEPDDSTEKN